MLAVRARLLTFLSGLSLLLCLAAMKLWLRSYGVHDEFWWDRVSHGPQGQDVIQLDVGCDRGGLYLARIGYRYPQWLLKIHPEYRRSDGSYSARRSRDSSGLYPYQGRRAGAPVALRRAGFELTTGLGPNPKDPHRQHTAALVVPLWAVTLLTALASGRFLVRLLRRPTRLDGARPCPRCNYDLRATPDRCPECGTPAGSKKAPAGNPGI